MIEIINHTNIVKFIKNGVLVNDRYYSTMGEYLNSLWRDYDTSRHNGQEIEVNLIIKTEK